MIIIVIAFQTCQVKGDEFMAYMPRINCTPLFGRYIFMDFCMEHYSEITIEFRRDINAPFLIAKKCDITRTLCARDCVTPHR